LDKLLTDSYEEGEGGKGGATAPPGLTVRLTDTFPVGTFAADTVDGAEVDMDAACVRAIPRPHAVPDGADNDEAAAAAVAAAAASPPLRRRVPLVRGASDLLDTAAVSLSDADVPPPPPPPVRLAADASLVAAGRVWVAVTTAHGGRLPVVATTDVVAADVDVLRRRAAAAAAAAAAVSSVSHSDGGAQGRRSYSKAGLADAPPPAGAPSLTACPSLPRLLAAADATTATAGAAADGFFPAAPSPPAAALPSGRGCPTDGGSRVAAVLPPRGAAPGVCVVLQSPHGNVEVFEPRAPAIAAIASAMRGHRFGSDLAAVRPQRLPADIFVDAAGSPLGREGGGGARVAERGTPPQIGRAPG